MRTSSLSGYSLADHVAEGWIAIRLSDSPGMVLFLLAVPITYIQYI